MPFQELLGELVREGRNSRASRLALVWRDQEISYLSLDAQIDQVAASFLRLGVTGGDRVALYMHNLPQFVVSLYALQRIGAVPVPIPIYWKNRDLRYLLAESRVYGVVTIAPLFERVQELRESLPEIRWVVAITATGPQPRDSLSWEDLLGEPSGDPVEVELDASQPALLSFTAGRTGPSRPVLLSHFNLLANCQQMQDLAQVTFWGDEDVTEQSEGISLTQPRSKFETVLLPLPLFNLFSLNLGLNLTYMLGGTVVLMERFDPAQALHLIEARGCTVVYGSPATFQEMVESPEFVTARLGSLRYAFSYGAPLSQAVRQKWLDKTGDPIFSCYGTTEASPLLSCEAVGRPVQGRPAEQDSIGLPLPMVQLTFPHLEGTIPQAEAVGQIQAKGPNLMLGYFNPQEPDLPITGRVNGMFNTGDLAQVDEDGLFNFIDRVEDVLTMPDGELLVPRDIEAVLCDHPGVWEAAALPYSAPDGRNGMVAFVVLNEASRDLTEPQLFRYSETRLPARLHPQRIFIYRGEELPRLPTGAVWRRALRAQIPDYL